MNNSASYRAWRFDLPGPDDAAGAGLSIAPTGGVALVSGDAAIRQAILLLLSTEPGERVMRVDYGCRLQRVAFMPNDDTTAGLAIHYVRQALMRWEPRIDVLQLDAGANPEDPGRLDVVLTYRVRATQRTDQIVFPVQLDGEQG